VSYAADAVTAARLLSVALTEDDKDNLAYGYFIEALEQAELSLRVRERATSSLDDADDVRVARPVHQQHTTQSTVT